MFPLHLSLVCVCVCMCVTVCHLSIISHTIALSLLMYGGELVLLYVYL